MKTDLYWYALYCKSRHERLVHARLLEKGYGAYLADYETRTQQGSRLRAVKKNLLPGYVLVQTAITPQTHLDILQTKSVVKFVGRTWPHLSWIPEAQVESLKLLLRSRQRFEEVAYWANGDAVEVIAGPLLGLRGVFAGETSRADRVIVSLDLLQRSLAVEIDTKLLRRVSAPFAASARTDPQEVCIGSGAASF